MLTNIPDGLDFAQVTPPPNQGPPAAVKVMIYTNGGLRVSLNYNAMLKLGNPSAVYISCAEHNGRGYISLRAADPGAQGVFKVNCPKKKGGWLVLHDLPFQPGVIHPSTVCEFSMDADLMLIQCPDWDEMLGAAEADEEEEQ